MKIVSLEEAKTKAPAIFADRPAPRVSKNYTFASSLEMIEHMDKAGWKLTDARQSKTSKDVYQNYGTHIMKFSHPELFINDNRGGIEGRPQIVVLNDHLGNRPLQIEAGFFRIACENGLMIKSHDFGGARTRHLKVTQDIVGKIIDEHCAKTEKAINDINRWIMREMTDKERFAFATEALALRLSGDRQPENYELISILQPKRQEDSQNDLWHVYNRCQENLVKGGFDLNERTARAITNPVLDMDLNMKLWAIAEKYSNKN